MDDQILTSGRDTLLVAIPFVMCMVGSIFPLDGLFFKSEKSSLNKCMQPLRGVGPWGEPIFTDPGRRLVECPSRHGSRHA
jgi:hypothetical protein